MGLALSSRQTPRQLGARVGWSLVSLSHRMPKYISSHLYLVLKALEREIWANGDINNSPKQSGDSLSNTWVPRTWAVTGTREDWNCSYTTYWHKITDENLMAKMFSRFNLLVVIGQEIPFRYCWNMGSGTTQVFCLARPHRKMKETSNTMHSGPQTKIYS